MDLRDFNTLDAAERGAWMPLRDPFTGDVLEDDGKPVRILLYGKDSRNYRRKRNAVAAEARNRAVQRREINADDLEADMRKSIEIVAACIGGHDTLAFNGKQVDLTDIGQALEVLSDPGNAWIVEQCDGWIHNRGNYDPRRSATSASGSNGSPGSSSPRKAAAPSGSTT